MLDSWLKERILNFESEGRKRALGPEPLAQVLDFSSNDYLGLRRNPRVLTALRSAESAGAGSSRLVSGTTAQHLALEEDIAAFMESGASLVFGAGYLANVGLCQSLIQRYEHVFADRLVHASLLDGIALSSAKLHRYRHCDVEHLSELLESQRLHRKPGARFFIVTESVFSMDGDLAPLADLCALAEEHDAVLIVDEAHAVGVCGREGKGCAADLNLLSADFIRTGTLSKAFGSYGGFVAGSCALKEYLINSARSFIYNTALPVPAVLAAREAIQILREEPGAGALLLARARAFQKALASAGLNLSSSTTHIVPVVVGKNEAAVQFSLKLRECGVHAIAMRTPTVPEGTARVRFSLSLSHTEDELREAAGRILEAAKAVGLL